MKKYQFEGKDVGILSTNSFQVGKIFNQAGISTYDFGVKFVIDEYVSKGLATRMPNFYFLGPSFSDRYHVATLVEIFKQKGLILKFGDFKKGKIDDFMEYSYPLIFMCRQFNESEDPVGGLATVLEHRMNVIGSPGLNCEVDMRVDFKVKKESLVGMIKHIRDTREIVSELFKDYGE